MILTCQQGTTRRTMSSPLGRSPLSFSALLPLAVMFLRTASDNAPRTTATLFVWLVVSTGDARRLAGRLGASIGVWMEAVCERSAKRGSSGLVSGTAPVVVTDRSKTRVGHDDFAIFLEALCRVGCRRFGRAICGRTALMTYAGPFADSLTPSNVNASPPLAGCLAFDRSQLPSVGRSRSLVRSLSGGRLPGSSVFIGLQPRFTASMLRRPGYASTPFTTPGLRSVASVRSSFVAKPPLCAFPALGRYDPATAASAPLRLPSLPRSPGGVVPPGYVIRRPSRPPRSGIYAVWRPSGPEQPRRTSCASPRRPADSPCPMPDPAWAASCRWEWRTSCPPLRRTLTHAPVQYLG